MDLGLAEQRARERRIADLRRALKDARRRNDKASVALIVQWLSDEQAAS